VNKKFPPPDNFIQVSHLKEKIEILDLQIPEIYALVQPPDRSKGVVLISPGICTRQLHLLEPFIGYQLFKRGYTVATINTLDLSKYGLDPSNPFHRVMLTQEAYRKIGEFFPEQKIVGLGHSLGCIDLLHARPANLEACVFVSPGFKGDKRKFAFKSFWNFLWSFYRKGSFKIYPHGLKQTPDLDFYKTDSVDAQFLWNLQKYAHGLQKTHFWPLNKPAYIWLGSSEASDGVVEMAQANYWAQQMQNLNNLCKVKILQNAGHEPGWKNPLDAKNLASDLNDWLEQMALEFTFD
jgi:pimeloyl-ACP methyl ester carboxylesterase